MTEALTKEEMHEWARDEDGSVKYIESGGYHGGPRCIRCGDSFCQHCYPEKMTERCPEACETLPGMEEMPQPLPENDRVKVVIVAENGGVVATTNPAEMWTAAATKYPEVIFMALEGG